MHRAGPYTEKGRNGSDSLPYVRKARQKYLKDAPIGQLASYEAGVKTPRYDAQQDQ